MGFCLEPPLVLGRGEQSPAGWLRGYGPSSLSPLTFTERVTNNNLQHILSSSLVLIYLFMKEVLWEPLPCWPQLCPGVFDSRAGITRVPAVFPAHCQLWKCWGTAWLEQSSCSSGRGLSSCVLSQLIPMDKILPSHRIRGWGPEGPGALVSAASLLTAGSARAGCWLRIIPRWLLKVPKGGSSITCVGSLCQGSASLTLKFPDVQDKAPKFLLVALVFSLGTTDRNLALILLPFSYFCALMAFPQTCSPPDHCARSCSHQHSPPALHVLPWMRLTPGHTTATCHIPQCWFAPHWARIWMLSMWGSSVLHCQEDQLSMAPGSNFSTAAGEKVEGSDHYL